MLSNKRDRIEINFNKVKELYALLKNEHQKNNTDSGQEYIQLVTMCEFIALCITHASTKENIEKKNFAREAKTPTFLGTFSHTASSAIFDFLNPFYALTNIKYAYHRFDEILADNPKNYNDNDKRFFMDNTIQLGFKMIREKLAVNKSAAVYQEGDIGKFFLFATDLPQTNCTMIGYVPWAAVAGDIFRIYTLLLFGGTLMFIFLAMVSAYLFVVRTKAEESDALRKAKKMADDANKAKSIFLANMSHEIRTPLNAIVGMNEMILRESQNPDILGYAQNAFAASETLLSLINDILDFSKIESGKLELVEDNYKLDNVIKGLVNMIRPRAERKNLSFDVKVNPSIENFLFGDSVRIRQIALNILSNAVKYT